MKDVIEQMESMVNHDSIIDFQNDETIIDKSCQDMVIIDPTERKTDLTTPEVSQDRIDDYHYVRNIYINAITQGEEALTGLLEMVRASPSPRGFEVIATQLKTNSDNADKLMKLQKEYKDLSEVRKSENSQTADTINNNNIAFSGSPEELIDMLNGDTQVIE